MFSLFGVFWVRRSVGMLFWCVNVSFGSSGVVMVLVVSKIVVFVNWCLCILKFFDICV